MSSILVDKSGLVGYLTLARIGGLNALTLDMVQDLRSGLNRHLDDPQVGIICLRSADSKAFCAGGDMKRIRAQVLGEQLDRVEAFFRAEYALNQAIAESDKPVVALIDGIAMGGGFGLSVHAQHSLVTENARLAMPEARIGFYPDVGGTWFLPRLGGRLGYWLAMTGATIDADVAVACGLADARIPAARLEVFNLVLRRTEPDRLNALLQAEAQPVESPEHLHHYSSWFEGGEPKQAFARLAAAERDRSLPEAVRTLAAQSLQQVHQASPHSLALIAQLFDHQGTCSLDECLGRELQASVAAATHPDMAEGVRAMLVDKDNKPRWAATI